jgi:hypothetical protein
MRVVHVHARTDNADLPKLEEAWAEMLELPPQAPEAPTFPAEMIPEPLREWIDDAAERICVHREFIAVPAIAVLGAVLGRRIGLHPKQRDDWLEVPNLRQRAFGHRGNRRGLQSVSSVTPSVTAVSPRKKLRALRLWLNPRSQGRAGVAAPTTVSVTAGTFSGTFRPGASGNT